MPTRQPSSQLAATMAAARRAACLTMEQLAVRAGTTRSTVRLVETYGIRPRPALLRRLCEALNLPLGDLPPAAPPVESHTRTQGASSVVPPWRREPHRRNRGRYPP